MDCYLCLDELNQRYLSGFAFTDGLLLITATDALLITDGRYIELAEKTAYPEFRCVVPESRKETIHAFLKEGCVRTVGMEGNSVPFSVWKSYETEYPEVTFTDMNGTVEELRQIKTPEEIALMQKAQDITDAAFAATLPSITPNMSEIEVAAELEYQMRKRGAGGFAFDTIAVSGDASALPHGVPRNEKLHRGFLTMDFGAKYNGYCSDMTRTIVIGQATAEEKKLYGTVLKAQTDVLSYLKAGADAGRADALARDYIEAEYPGTFNHGLGHSVGLYIHESPSLNKRSFDRALRTGEIVTVEPGIYLFGKYGCRIEDMVEIVENGVMNFTKSPKELIEVF